VVRATFLVCAVCLSVIYAYFGTRQALLSPVWPYLTLYSVAFAVYLYGGLRLLPHLKDNSRIAVLLIVLAGIGFRLILLTAKPSLSTDIYRYIWDGRLITHGINPYQWAPYDPRLGRFHDATIWFPMDYKYYNTVYMPVSQAVFAAIYLMFGSHIEGFKFVYIAFDVAVMGMIVLLLRQRKFPVTNVYWYAWCPLPLTEIAIAGHQDIVGVFCLLCALAFMLSSRPLKACALLMAAGFTKGFAFLLLPVFIRRYGVRFGWYAAAAFAVLGLPLWLCMRQFLHGMEQYLGTVHVNSGIFHFVYTIIRLILPVYAYSITSWLSKLAVLAVTWWSIRDGVNDDTEMIRRAIVVIAVCLLVVPTLFPWYLLWLLPLVLIYKPRPSGAFIALSGTVSLMYLYYYNFTILWWFRVIEYAPFYLLIWQEIKDGYWLGLGGAAADAAAGGSGAIVGDGCADPAAVK